jgi:hypothetical protein
MGLLAMGVSSLALKPGLPFQQIWQFLMGQLSFTRPTAPAMGNLPGGELLMKIYRAIFLTAVVLFPFAVILVLVTPELRKRVLRAALRLALLFLLVSLLTRNQSEVELSPEGVGAVPEAPEPAQVEPLDVEEFSAERISPWVVWAISLGIGATAAAVAVAAVTWYRRVRAEKVTPLEEIARRAEATVAGIRLGEDLKDAVLRCYAEMSRVVQEERGISRDRAVTAREFTEYLVKAKLPQEPVDRLTTLFERVRYGTRAATSDEEQEAIASLRAIAEACRRAA